MSDQRDTTEPRASVAEPAVPQSPEGGASPRKRGPIVFGTYDQFELDAAYDQNCYAPLGEQVRQRLASESEAVRARLGPPRRFAFGPTEVEGLDVYASGREGGPVFIFIHGGAWRAGFAKNYAYPAELFVNAGAHYVVPDFISVDMAGGDLAVMAEQVRRAIAWTYANAAAFGGNPARIYVGGHSSGGHLCAVALTTDWPGAFGLPADLIKGALCMSGMYDLAPVRLSKRGSYVKFTDEMEVTMSPQRHLAMIRAPVMVTYGTNETPEFQRQSREFAARLDAAGKQVHLTVATHYNHFEMAETLANPYGPNGRAALALMGLSTTG